MPANAGAPGDFLDSLRIVDISFRFRANTGLSHDLRQRTLLGSRGHLRVNFTEVLRFISHRMQ
jgi:hypothetical protein